MDFWELFKSMSNLLPSFPSLQRLEMAAPSSRTHPQFHKVMRPKCAKLCPLLRVRIGGFVYIVFVSKSLVYWRPFPDRKEL